jgi:hypothetical protein
MFALALLALLAPATPPSSRTPEELVERVQARFSAGSLEDFRAVYPFEDGLEPVRSALKHNQPRKPGLGRVLRTDGARAVLLLSGVAVSANSGDDVSDSRTFSGLYEARLDRGAWTLHHRLPLDDGNRILKQSLDVTIAPGASLDITDRLGLEVDGEHGFLARLNHRARLDKVLWNDQPAEHAFGGGLLWVRVGKGGRGTLTLAYHLEVEHGPTETNSACFLPDFGHVRNQYFWHPFFDFSSGRDRADFDITARIPSAYRVATSIPQTETIEGRHRVVRGRTIQAAFALTLLYDRRWRLRSKRLGPVKLDVFATPDFDPPVAQVMKEFEDVYRFLSGRFGVPKLGYFAVAQGRARDGSAWRFASNQTLVAAARGARMIEGGDTPKASFGHELSHLWTQGAGPATNFLQEGWAMFVETALLRARLGEEPRRRLMSKAAEIYFGAFDGKLAILSDHDNAGVSYMKGMWVFAMLEDILGPKAFDKAMTEFSRRSLEQPATWEVLLECLNRHSERDLRGFLVPWLEQASAPRLQTRIAGNRVTIVQAGPRFQLPVEVEVETADGRDRRRMWVEGAETTVEFATPVRRAAVDPDGRLLLVR